MEISKVLEKEAFKVKTEELLERYIQDDMVIMRWNIDRYRTLFTLYGQEVCDRLVSMLSTYLMETFDEKCTTVGRISEESIVLCSMKNPSEYQERINMAASILNQLNVGSLISLSVGIYEIGQSRTSIMEMCDRAAIPIDDLRSSYANQYAYYDPNIIDSRQFDQSIILDMDDALRNEEFVIYLQPIVSISENHVASAEALVRWIHPKRGIISPGLFIPLFEKNGFITKLDYYVWEHVCQYQRKRVDLGLPSLPISMNISRRTINDEDVPTKVHELVEKYQLDPSLIRLEITESAYMDDAQLLIETAERLKAYGYLVLMDDFGSGYSSLNMLKDLEVDILKIDMKFMENFDASNRAGNIITSIIRMANWLGMQVIAEGVETANTVIFLRGIGCNYMQGFFYSKPMPITEFEIFVSNKLNHAEEELSLKTNINVFDEFFNGNSAFVRLFNNAVGGLGIFELKNGDGEIIRINDIFYNMLGYEPSEFSKISGNIKKIIYPADHGLVLEGCLKCIASQKTQDVVLRVYNKEGSIVWLNSKLQFLGHSGENSLLSISATDITRLKNLEVKERVKRYSSAIVGLCEEIVNINLEERTAMIVNSKANNRNIGEIVSFEDSLKDTLNRIMPSDHDKVREFLNPDMIRHYSYSGVSAPAIEIQMCCGMSEVEWMRLVLLQVDESNYLVCGEDISKQKQVEMLTKEKLSSAQEQLSRMLEHGDMKQDTILIVDDEKINRILLRKYLEKDYKILEASDGAQAMDMIKVNRNRLCLILLDLYMPVLDGYGVLRSVENDPSLKHIPIIVISSTGEKEAESHVLKLGAMELLKKPFNHDVICQRVANTVKLVQLSANIAVNDVVMNEVPTNLVVCSITGDKVQVVFISRWMAQEVFKMESEELFEKFGHDAANYICEEGQRVAIGKIINASKHHEILNIKVRLRIDEGECALFQVIGKFAYHQGESEFYYYAFNQIENNLHNKKEISKNGRGSNENISKQ